MSKIPELIKGRLHSLIDWQGSHRVASQPNTHECGPNSTQEIPWDKFKRYFHPLPDSIGLIKPQFLTFGDAYVTTRNSGKELTILPMHIKEWRRKRSVVDMLLILGFNSNNAVVGMRTVALDLSSPEYISAEGAVASAVCNDGIASAMEQVRDRTSRELLAFYRDRGFFFTGLNHTIVDENKKVVDALKHKAKSDKTDPLMQERYNHALDDRPRWETLFDEDKSGFEQTGRIIQLKPDDSIRRGFRSDTRTVFKMLRSPVQDGRADWIFEELGPEAYDYIAERGLTSKKYVQQRMAESLVNPPEV